MNETKLELKHKPENKNSTIGIVGLGYVWLPLAIRYTELGYNVVGFDMNVNNVVKV